MSLQELKTLIIKRVNEAADERSLELLAEVADQVLPPASSQSPGLTDSELAAALKGRAQIAAGRTGSHADMQRAVRAAIDNARRKAA